MIDKYKLIKEYPGSPKLEYISTQKLDLSKEHYWSGSWFKPSEFPEFWEKVVEKDYEILSFIHNGDHGVPKGHIVTMKDGFVFPQMQFLSESHYLKSKCWDIYSVKRLSDREIFTVGDMIGYLSIPNIKIESFTIRDNKIAVWGKFISYMHGFLLLNDVKKFKKPLFITDDGVEKFEGNLFYTTHTKYLGETWNPIPCDVTSEINIGVYKNSFSTIDLCKKYIEENKPQYSKKEVCEILRNFDKNINEYELDDYSSYVKK